MARVYSFKPQFLPLGEKGTGATTWKPFGRKRALSPALRAYAALTANAARGAVRAVSQIEQERQRPS